MRAYLADIGGAYERSCAPSHVWSRPVRTSLFALAMFALSACATPADASSDAVADISARAENPLAHFQRQEAYLFGIGYRLGTANAPYCDARQPELGFLLHDMRAYAQPDIARRTFGLTGDIGIQAVAAGSPAAIAGLRQNDTLLAVDGIAIPDDPSLEQDWQRAADLREAIGSSAVDGAVSLRWRDRSGVEKTAELVPVQSCTSTFELLSGDDGAAADGTRVLVGEGFPGFAYPSDEFAAVLAHEMAHNVLGNTGIRKRNAERDADRLMPWLLANADYDPAAASRMMRRYGPRHGGGLFRARTHDGWDERVEMIDREIAAMQSVSSKTGDFSADWKTHFKPLLEID